MGIVVQPADRSHFSRLREIERRAFETLRAVGAVSGEAKTNSDAELQAYLHDCLLYAAFDESGEPVGYVGGFIAGDCLHVDEMDVHPDHQRRGIGRQMMEAILQEGRARKLVFATLTTDRFAPFNAPFYASLGFEIIEGQDLSERLRCTLELEAEKGLDPRRRVAMRARLDRLSKV